VDVFLLNGCGCVAALLSSFLMKTALSVGDDFSNTLPIANRKTIASLSLAIRGMIVSSKFSICPELSFVTLFCIVWTPWVSVCPDARRGWWFICYLRYRMIGPAHPGLWHDQACPVGKAWDAAKVILDMLFADQANGHLSAITVGDGDAEDFFCHPDAFGMMAQGPVPEIREDEFAFIKPGVDRLIIFRHTAPVFDACLCMVKTVHGFAPDQ
jgi:hypothetical protein